MRKLSFYTKLKLCMLPAVAGLGLFYFLPFLKVLYYSVLKGQYQKKFVWLQNYKNVLMNEYFQLACRNTLKLIFVCVPVFLLVSIWIALLSLYAGRMGHFVRKLSILPLFLPSVSVVAAFLVVFEHVESELPVYSIFLWKYIGMGVVILAAAFSSVEPEIYEAARMDGAGTIAIHAFITLPVCAKPILFTVVLGVVYCFRTFRESYLYYGANYPPDYSYTLQYYMNNQFLKLNYQSMAAASVMITVLLAGFVALCRRNLYRKDGPEG